MRPVGWAAVLLLLALFFLPVFPEDASLSRMYLANAAHVPLMALVAIGMCGLLRTRARYPLAAGCAALAAAAIEIGQGFLSRDPSFGDLWMGLLGIAIGLAGLRVWETEGAARLRAAHAGLTLLLLAAVLRPAAMTWLAERRRDRAVPTLADFETELELRLWTPVGGSTADWTAAPASDGGRALRIHTPHGSWVGIDCNLGDMDWRPYAALEYDVYNPGAMFRLGVRVDDRASRDYDSRYQSNADLAPGWNHFRIELADVRSFPKSRPLDLSAVRRLRFYVGRDEPSRVFVLDHIRLIGRQALPPSPDSGIFLEGMEEPRVERTYSGPGRGRCRAKHDRGRLVELEDSSQWSVSPGQEIYTAHWPEDSEVTVVPGTYSNYPYDLINLQNGERVAARYLGCSEPSFGWQIVDDDPA